MQITNIYLSAHAPMELLLMGGSATRTFFFILEDDIRYLKHLQRERHILVSSNCFEEAG